jgi:arginine utilization protein RocB
MNPCELPLKPKFNRFKKNSSKQQLHIMSFQAYLDNIKAKTGKTPDDFKKLAEEKGFMVDGKLNPTTKATEITNWLKEEFDLGHGHAMAIFASFKGKTD